MQNRIVIGAAGLVGLVAVAWVQVGASAEPGPAQAPALPRVRCKVFPTEIGAMIDTRDASQELGQWVLSQEDQGWAVRDVRWEVGQKPTGYAQGYTHVCMEPVQ